LHCRLESRGRQGKTQPPVPCGSAPLRGHPGDLKLESLTKSGQEKREKEIPPRPVQIPYSSSSSARKTSAGVGLLVGMGKDKDKKQGVTADQTNDVRARQHHVPTAAAHDNITPAITASPIQSSTAHHTVNRARMPAPRAAEILYLEDLSLTLVARLLESGIQEIKKHEGKTSSSFARLFRA
jgi:hypothetical protein